MRLLLASERFSEVSLQNALGRTALHCAAEQGSEDVAKSLLSHGRFSDEAVNALAAEHMPWTWAGREVTVERGCTALHVAARFGKVVVTKALLEAGRFKEVNAVTVQGTFQCPTCCCTVWASWRCQTLVAGSWPL